MLQCLRVQSGVNVLGISYGGLDVLSLQLGVGGGLCLQEGLHLLQPERHGAVPKFHALHYPKLQSAFLSASSPPSLVGAINSLLLSSSLLGFSTST